MSKLKIDIHNFEKIYFLGIGGIGMSALAQWFKANGKQVSGYDKTETHLTEKLSQLGISVNYKDEISAIPENFKNDVLVVYTPAVPTDSVQLIFFENNNIPILKRAQVLGMITKDFLTVAVAGTHGKTTTSTMVAHLLHSAGKQTTAFLGGISVNLNSNLLIAQEEDEQIIVAEADEYDRSFLQLHPDIAVITSVEPDHLDIYGKAEALTDSFKKFSKLIPQDGTLIVHEKFARFFKTNFSYSLNKGDYFAKNRKTLEGKIYFDAQTPQGVIKNIPLHQPGHHNIENALAAIAVAQQLEISDKNIIKAFESYKGVRRRFEYILQSEKFVFIDDYAHHPTEINAFLTSLKELYPSKKITAIFQPHLYSRTRDFADGFSESLSIADEIILLDIYPARELPIEGVSSKMLLEKISTKKSICSKENLLKILAEKKDLEILATIGAGDIDTLVEPIKKYFEKVKTAL